MSDDRKKITIQDLFLKKTRQEKITRVALYDYPAARIAEVVGIDMILVGDSLGMNMLGFSDTLSVTMDMITIFTEAVRRGAPSRFIVADMPFGSYFTKERAFENAIRLIRAGADAIKIEGGEEICKIVSELSRSGIIVHGHIGLTPQSYKKTGGFKVQGIEPKQAMKILKNAKMLEEAGCLLLLLEAVPPDLAKIITQKLSIPIIGLGAGPHCDGITIIFHDLVGFTKRSPRFAKAYCNLNQILSSALAKYKEEVEAGIYPNEEYCYLWPDDKKQLFMKMLEDPKEKQ